ncbi:MAG: HAD-IA family hydrolase, partial [Oscillospiraceae bacterium]
MKQFKLSTIIYDLDGTLANTKGDIVNAVRNTLMAFDVVPPDDDTVGGFIGGGARNVIKRALGEDNEKLLDEAVTYFSDYYHSHIVERTYLYPGVIETLEYFKNKKRQTLATFKSKPGTKSVLEHFGIDKYFEMVVTAGDVEHPKPDPECLNVILKRYGLDPRDALLIGDTPTDMKTGKNAGVVVCAVDYGFAPPEELLEYSPDC